MRSRRVLGAGVAALAVLAVGGSLADGAAGARRVHSGVTSLSFDPDVLADLGIELAEVAGAGEGLRDGALGFAVDASRSTAAFEGARNDFEGFAAADLRHTGGFALRHRGARVDLSGFALTETAPPHALALRDAGGKPWLFVDAPHALLSGNELALSYADLVLAPALAEWLGRADLAGRYVGVLDAELSFAPAPLVAEPLADGVTGGCAGDFTQPIDLLMVQISSLTQSARQAGVRVAVAPSATVRNLGPGDVPWYRAIAPASPLGPHPYLALAFYRLSNGVLEQIARADLKHTFFATNDGCPCPGDQILYVGCDDTYGIATNLDRTNLAPRSEIDALTLAWSSLGSHFDGAPVDDVRSHGGDSVHDSFEHRLVVREPDLATPGARYFYDGWYMAPDDTDLGNSMGHREVDPMLNGSIWSFPAVDAGTANGSILDVWVDPQNVQPGQATELVDTGAGRVHLAVVTSALGGGDYHYEFALVNYDVERQIQSFSLPVLAGQTISNTGFGDGNADPLDDWTATVAGGRVTWTAPAGHALDWGTLFNFRMDADAAPVEGAATLTPLAPGSPDQMPVRTLPEPGVAGLGSALALLAGLWRTRVDRSGRRTSSR
jgi:hypothetical protein